jgi:hypothetical protein
MPLSYGISLILLVRLGPISHDTTKSPTVSPVVTSANRKIGSQIASMTNSNSWREKLREVFHEVEQKKTRLVIEYAPNRIGSRESRQQT